MLNYDTRIVDDISNFVEDKCPFCVNGLHFNFVIVRCSFFRFVRVPMSLITVSI